MGENRQGWRPLGLATSVALALGMIAGMNLIAAPAHAREHGEKTTARWSGALRSGSLTAVNAAYWSQYAGSMALPVSWVGGSLDGCRAGASAASSNSQTLRSLNYVRSLAGLAPVTFSSSLNSAAQQTALMMAANRTLDHHPGRSWRCWSSTGAATAGKSNLALAYPSIRSGQIIDLYMEDAGSTNTAVGHRRWLLNPFSTTMGTGSTDNANAMVVIGPTKANRPNPRWVGWPTAGYFPNPMEPSGRWSLSSGLRNASFAKAKIKVKYAGRKVAIRKFRVVNGYGMPTVVWQMPSSMSKNGNYRVIVKNIRLGKKRVKHAYTVSLFTPTH